MRWLGLAVAVALLWKGWSERDVGNQFMRLGGKYAEIILTYLGSAAMLRWAALTLLVCAAAGFLARWALPYLLGSRPTILGLPPHSHRNNR